MRTLDQVEKHLHPGAVYRRSDLEKWSKAVDRHLQQLQKKGVLTKLSGGLYYYPKKTVFGEAPANDQVLVASFLCIIRSKSNGESGPNRTLNPV